MMPEPHSAPSGSGGGAVATAPPSSEVNGVAVPAISGTRLTKSFPGVRAVNDVTFEVHRGEVHGLVGENGAGKSTLVKMFSGACVPDAGEVRVMGELILDSSPLASRRAGVATIYQEPNVVP